MSFPGVVKPSPWPGLQGNSQFHPGPLWHHHSHLHGTHASPMPSDVSEKISATTRFKVLPQAPQRYATASPSTVVERPARDSDSPATLLVGTSPFPRPPAFVLEDHLTIKPAPHSNESEVISPPKQQVPVSTSPTAPDEGVVRIGANEESSAGIPMTPQLSPTSAARKQKRIRRRRCGSCAGCSRNENCGTCSVCTNQNTTNSVCKLRRCDILKRRVSITPNGTFRSVFVNYSSL